MNEQLYNYHDDWIRLALSLGAGSMAQDIVQDMYIKVIEKYDDQPEKIIRDGRLNTYFIYVVLRNMIFDEHRKKAKDVVMYLDKNVQDWMNQIPDTPYNYQQDADIELRLECAQEEIKNWHWYNQKLWNTYHQQNITMRKLSKETTISLSSIFNTIKNGRQSIKKAYKKKRQTT